MFFPSPLPSHSVLPASRDRKLEGIFRGGLSFFRRAGLRLGVGLISLWLATAAQAQLYYTINGGPAAFIAGDYTITVSGYDYYDYSFVEAVEIPDSVGGRPVVSIGNHAFGGGGNLTSIMIPNSVTSIGDYAFVGCGKLTNITIPSSVTNIGHYAFVGCGKLTNITILNGITGIGDLAFAGCSGLTSITIPSSVTNIGDLAFEGCFNLTNITIPNSVTGIGMGAFWSCSSLKDIYFQGNAPDPGLLGIFIDGAQATAYYLPGTTGWDTTFSSIPTVALLATEPPVIQNNQATLNWLAMPGKACRVEYRADLTSGDWTVVTNLTAIQLNTSITLPVTGRQGFYRIGMEP